MFSPEEGGRQGLGLLENFRTTFFEGHNIAVNGPSLYTVYLLCPIPVKNKAVS